MYASQSKAYPAPPPLSTTPAQILCDLSCHTVAVSYARCGGPKYLSLFCVFRLTSPRQGVYYLQMSARREIETTSPEPCAASLGASGAHHVGHICGIGAGLGALTGGTMKIEVVTRLDDGIYASDGGGQRRVVATYPRTPRGLMLAVDRADRERQENIRGYGNIGCGWTSIRIGSSWLDRDEEDGLQRAMVAGMRAYARSRGENPGLTRTEEAAAVLGLHTLRI